MKFRRRAEEASPPQTGVEAGVGTGVEAVFAAVLDGRHLWLAVDERRGHLALRSGGGVLELPAVHDDQPGYLATRIDLAPLPPGVASYDVVLVGEDATVPVTTGAPASTRVATGPEGTRRTLVRGDDAALRLRTDDLGAAATLVSVALEDDGPRLEVETPSGRVVLGPHDLAPGPVTVGRDRLPVRRHDDDLPDPGRGAPMPSWGDLRLRWSRDGLLLVRAVERGEP